MLPWFRQTLPFPKRHRGRAWLALETLESRTVPSITAGLAGGILSLTSDDAVNRVQVIQPSPDQVRVLESDQEVGTFAADQVQLVVFQHGSSASTFENQTALPAKQLRLFGSPRLSADELNQTGTLDALLVGDTLTLAGPSGAGFQITGAWAAATDGTSPVQHTFTASGDMVLRTAVGDLPFVASDQAPLTITTTGALTADFGAVDAVTWSSDQVLNTVDDSNPLHRFADQFGLQLDAGAVAFGIKLGNDLASLGVPLNKAVPYLYTTVTGASAAFGDIAAAISTDNPLSLAFDPADPSLYACAHEFCVGGSLSGYIPYTPTSALADSGDPIYGHLYAKGSWNLGDLPANFTGEAVLDLDAGHDGQLLQALQGSMASQLATGQLTLNDFAQAALNDLRVGVNGHADIGYSANGFDFNLPLDLSTAYVPGRLTAHATAAANPFTNTPLAFLGTSAPVDITANLDDQGTLAITATVDTATAAGVSITGLTVAFTNAGVTIDANLDPAYGFGPVAVHGSASADGRFTLTAQADVTVGSFSISGTVTLTNDGLGFTGRLTMPGLGSVDLAGSANSQGSLVLHGTADITVAGFAAAGAVFTLDRSGLAVDAHLVVADIGDIEVSGTIDTRGQYNLHGTANITVAGFNLPSIAFTATNGSLSATTDLSLPGGSQVHLTGSILAPNQVQLTGTATLIVAGFNLGSAGFTLSNTKLAVTASLSLPGGSTVRLDGTLDKQGQYSLTGTANITVAGFPLAASFTLTNSSLTVAAHANLPLLNQVDFSGTVAGGQFTLTASLPRVDVLGFTLTNVAATLTSTSLTVRAHGDFPIVGQVDVAGIVVAGGTFTLTATAPSVTFLGFTLKNVFVTLSNAGLLLGAQTELPVLGLVTFAGLIGAGSQFALTATVTQLQILGFALNDVALTLSRDGVSLRTWATIPVLGRVTFAGSFSSAAQFAVSATLQRFTVAGFTLENAAVKLTQHSLNVSAHASFINIGQIDFTGTIEAGGRYSFRAKASLVVAGFTLPGADVTIGTDRLAVGVCVPLPMLGQVCLDGSYSPTGQFSFHALVPGPVVLGGIPFTDLGVGLTNDSLTVGACVGIRNLATACFSGWIDTHADFKLTASVTAFHLAGFSLANGILTLTPRDLTLKARVDIPLLVQVNVDGYFIFSTSAFSLTGTATIGVASFTLSNTSFTLTNSGMRLQSHTNIPGIGFVDFDGSVTSEGQIAVRAVADVTIAGFPLAHASLALDNRHLAVAGSLTVPNVGFVSFSGTVDNRGQFDLLATASFHVADFRVDNAQLHLTNTRLDIAASIGVASAGSVSFSGYVTTSGQFDLNGTATLTVAGFPLAGAHLHLSNSRMDIAVSFTIPSVGGANVSGFVTSSGQFDLQGNGWFTVAGYQFNAFVHLTNLRVEASATIQVPFGGAFAFSGYVAAPNQFDLRVSGAFNVAGYQFNASLHLTNSRLEVATAFNVPYSGQISFVGFVTSSGQFDIQGRGAFTFAGYPFADAAVELTQQSLTVAVGLSIPNVGGANLKGSVAVNGQFSLSGNGSAHFAGFMVGAAFTLSNSGVSVAAAFDLGPVGWVNLSGSVSSNGQFSLHGDGNVHFAGFAASGSFTINNSGMTVSADVDLRVGHVRFGGALQVGGQFDWFGSGGVSFAGFGASGTFRLNNGGLSFSVQLDLRIVSAGFAGWIHSDGAFELQGSAWVSFAGFGATARFVVNNGGAHAWATINVLGAWANFDGYIGSNGWFELHGGAGVGFAGFGANAAFTLNNNGIWASADVNVRVATAHFDGSIHADGWFELHGSAGASFGDFGASMNFTLNNAGVSGSGSVNLGPFGSFGMSGYVHADGGFELAFDGGFRVLGFAANGSLRVNNGGAFVHFGLNSSVLGANLRFDGQVYPGGFSLSVGAGIRIGPVSAAASFTLSSAGFRVTVSGYLNLSTNIHGFDVGLTASLSVSFGIWATGDGGVDFSLSGSFSAQLHFGGTIGVGIGFSISNHEFRLRTSEIGVDIAGWHYHPFNDLVLFY